MQSDVLYPISAFEFHKNSPISQCCGQLLREHIGRNLCRLRRHDRLVRVAASMHNVVLVVLFLLFIVSVNIGHVVAAQLGHQSLHKRAAALAQPTHDGRVARRARRALVTGWTARARVVKSAAARSTQHGAHSTAITAVGRAANCAGLRASETHGRDV